MTFWTAVRNRVCGCIVAGAMLAGAGFQAMAQRSGHALKVHNGVLTVDGLPVATGLNLHVANLRYLYVALPGLGTAIIGEKAFAGAQEQKAAFHGNALTVAAEGRRLQLTSASRLRGNHSAYVRFDRGQDGGLRTPAISYGDAAMVPAVWPEQGIESRPLRRHLRVSGRRASRSAKLCRPSAHGRELCATVREVVYKP